jgi:glycerol kinase
LVVGGGVSASDMACQIQADMTGIPVVRPTFKQMTGYAAALMAGLGAGVWTDSAEIPPLDDTPTLFHPGIDDVTRQTRYDQWQRAITLAQAW